MGRHSIEVQKMILENSMSMRKQQVQSPTKSRVGSRSASFLAGGAIVDLFGDRVVHANHAKGAEP